MRPHATLTMKNSEENDEGSEQAAIQDRTGAGLTCELKSNEARDHEEHSISNQEIT
jgi:hypothetical protein